MYSQSDKILVWDSLTSIPHAVDFIYTDIVSQGMRKYLHERGITAIELIVQKARTFLCFLNPSPGSDFQEKNSLPDGHFIIDANDMMHQVDWGYSLQRIDMKLGYILHMCDFSKTHILQKVASYNV